MEISLSLSFDVVFTVNDWWPSSACLGAIGISRWRRYSLENASESKLASSMSISLNLENNNTSMFGCVCQTKHGRGYGLWSSVFVVDDVIIDDDDDDDDDKANDKNDVDGFDGHFSNSCTLFRRE